MLDNTTYYYRVMALALSTGSLESSWSNIENIKLVKEITNVIRVDSVTCRIGSEVTVEINYKCDQSISGMNLDLHFDNESAQVSSVELDDRASSMSIIGLDIEEANRSGILTLQLIDFSLSHPVPAGEGTIIRICFSDQAIIEQIILLKLKNLS